MKISGTFLIMKGKRKLRLSCAKGTGIGLLKASKAIHTEAAPVFYYGNHFIFANSDILEDFLNHIHEMTFFLSDVEIKIPSDSSRGGLRMALEKLRISSQPARIAIHGCSVFYRSSAIESAGDIWGRIARFVQRKGGAAFNSHDVATLRSHMHTGNQGKHPLSIFPMLTEEEELKRLRAFDFEVPEDMRFPVEGSDHQVTIEDVDKRAQRFTEMLEDEWRKNLRERKQRLGGKTSV